MWGVGGTFVCEFPPGILLFLLISQEQCSRNKYGMWDKENKLETDFWGPFIFGRSRSHLFPFSRSVPLDQFYRMEGASLGTPAGQAFPEHPPIPTGARTV